MGQSSRERIQAIVEESVQVKQAAFEANMDALLEAVSVMGQAVQQGGKLMFFGNGGSAADSQHIAAEFIGRFQKERRALPAMALTTDTSILTCLSNDYSYDIIFARQIEGLGKKGDVAIGISTSGKSPNVLEGLKKAKDMELVTVSLTGGDGGPIAALTDVSLVVPSSKTARIQETHICMAHTLCELIEDQF